MWRRYRNALDAAPAALAALDRAATVLRWIGTAVPLALIGAALAFALGGAPTTEAIAGAAAALAGVAAVFAGAWFKFTLVTRAGFNQGFALVQLAGARRPSRSHAELRRAGLRGSPWAQCCHPKLPSPNAFTPCSTAGWKRMPREKLAALQLDRLRTTLRNAYDHVPLQRQRLDAVGFMPGDMRTLADVAQLPFTLKSDLRDHYPFGMFARPVTQLARLHASSGTTGKPTVVGYTRGDLDHWADLMARSLACAGVRRGDVVHNAYGYGLFTGGLGAHYGAERLGAVVVPMSGGSTERQVALIMDFGARVLCATPSYALAIAEVAERQGVDLRASALAIGMFGAEPWSAAMRREIEERLGLEGGRHLRPVGNHGAGRRLRMPAAGRPARLGGPFPVRGHRPRERPVAGRGRGRRAGDHDADQGGAADAALPHPRHHAPGRRTPATAAARICASCASPGATTTC